MVEDIARNLIRRFGYEAAPLYLIADNEYRVLAERVKEQHDSTEIRCLSACAQDARGAFFDIPQDAAALLLVSPASFLSYSLAPYLDFSRGEPKLRNAASHVCIFPPDSLYRILAADPERDLWMRDTFHTVFPPLCPYRITAPGGTDLYFTARNWIRQDFEVCTAPVESSVHGVIAADGALFFGKAEETLLLRIENGKLRSIESARPQGQALADEYRRMTARAFQDPANLQLAEIGVGFCAGAQISDCFMEAEAAKNTCHFCFGNNVCYGGTNASEFHGASVLIRNPTFLNMQLPPGLQGGENRGIF